MRPPTRFGGGQEWGQLRYWGIHLLAPGLDHCPPPQLGLDMEELEEIEEDAGLGNGGLGRLAGKWEGGQGWGGQRGSVLLGP